MREEAARTASLAGARQEERACVAREQQHQLRQVLREEAEVAHVTVQLRCEEAVAAIKKERDGFRAEVSAANRRADEAAQEAAALRHSLAREAQKGERVRRRLEEAEARPSPVSEQAAEEHAGAVRRLQACAADLAEERAQAALTKKRILELETAQDRMQIESTQAERKQREVEFLTERNEELHGQVAELQEERKLIRDKLADASNDVYLKVWTDRCGLLLFSLVLF